MLASYSARQTTAGRKNVIEFLEARNAYLSRNNTPERSFNKCDVYFWLSSFLCALLYLFPITRSKWFNFKTFVSRAGISRDEATADFQG